MARRDNLTTDFLQLPQQERICVILHHRGYSAQKIAEALDIAPGAVYRHVLDGHIRLHASLTNDPRCRALLRDDA